LFGHEGAGVGVGEGVGVGVGVGVEVGPHVNVWGVAVIELPQPPLTQKSVNTPQ
jgi:hypothetical protein